MYILNKYIVHYILVNDFTSSNFESVPYKVRDAYMSSCRKHTKFHGFVWVFSDAHSNQAGVARIIQAKDGPGQCGQHFLAT